MCRAQFLTLLVLTIGASTLTSVATAAGADRSSQSANQIFADVVNEMSKVKSFHLEGSGIDKEGRATASVDAGVDRARIKMSGRGFRSIEVRYAARRVFYKSPRAFWRSAGMSTAVAKKLSGRWVRFPASFGDSVAAPFLTRNFGYCMGIEHGSIRKGPVATVGGQRAIVLIDAGDTPGNPPGRLYVAASGPARVLRLVQTGPAPPGGLTDPRCGKDDDEPDTTRSGDFRFGSYNKPINVAKPANALDLATVLKNGQQGQTI
jgi:hypothetical protein